MADVKTIVDFDALQQMPRMGGEWPPIWRAACQVLFINGFSPKQISTELKQIDGPSDGAISSWANDEDWYRERDEYTREVVRKSLDKTQSDAVDAVSRHLKELRLAQARLTQEIAGKAVTSKSLEGAVSALVTAIKAERQVLGINRESGDVTIQDNRVQTIVTSLTNVPAERRDEYFAAMRAKFEAEKAITQIASGEVEGKTTRSALYDKQQANAD